MKKMVSLYERALAQADGQSFVGIDYANHLYSLERWSEAADQYAHIVSPDAFEEVTRHYAVALLNAGRQAEALSFSQAVRERHGVRLGVTEVEAHVLRWLGDMKADLSLWQALHDLDPHNHLLKLRVAESLMLTRDFGGARDVAEAVDWRKLKKHPGDVMRLAHLRGDARLAGRARARLGSVASSSQRSRRPPSVLQCRRTNEPRRTPCRPKGGHAWQRCDARARGTAPPSRSPF